ncbi:MAG: PEGA domain-containing protein [Candidatus Korobacteraceae bacterium]
MKLLRILGEFTVAIIVASPLAFGQTTVASSTECSKNISFSVAEGGQPVPAIPKFVTKWIGDKKHQKDYSDLCFSQIPDPKAKNFVVVFSTLDSSFEGLVPTAHTYTRTPPVSENQAAVSRYGGTWDYSYLGPMNTAATATISLQYADKYKALFVRAYNQQGGLVSQYRPDTTRSREDMLGRVITDIRGYNQAPQNQKAFVAPLSVYYVNCDVDGPPAETAASPTSDAVPAEPPKQLQQDAILEFWSSPIGADVFVDGAYVGKAPYFLTVPPGEHTITMRKKDFGTWQRKMQISAGKRRVAGYLEQKAVTVGFGIP